VALLFCAWWLDRPHLRTLANGILATLLTTAVAFVWWSKPGWECTLSQALELQSLPPEDRAAYRIAWYLGEPETMKALDRELGAGDLVAFSEEFGFPAVLWNERFSNSLAYVPFEGGPSGYLRRLDELHAKWAVVKEGSPHHHALLSKPDTWERVGRTSD